MLVDLDLTIAATQEAITQAVKTSANNVVYRPATVAAVSFDGTIAEVVLDADSTNSRVGVQVLYPSGVVGGDRVMCVFVKPHGAFLVGRRGGDFDPWHYVGGAEDDPRFNTGWGNESGTGWTNTNTPARVAFRRHGRMVELRGRARRSSGASTAVFRLPPNYCPENDLIMAGVGALASFEPVEVERVGWVRVPTGNAFAVLDGITFSTNFYGEVGDSA